MSDIFDVVHHLKIEHHNILEARSASMFRWTCMGIETSSDGPTNVHSLLSHFYQKIEADPTFETLLYFQPEMKGSVQNFRHNNDPVPSL